MTSYVIGALFAAIGIAAIVRFCWDLVQSVESRSWRSAEGVVLVSDLQRSRDLDGGWMYRPEVSYRYEVDGAEYVSARARFGDWLELSWSKPAVRIVRRYPKGASVVVHYDPDNPAQAVLEPGITGNVLGGLAFGSCFALIGFALLARG